jgi:hypothetical protein
MDGIRWMLDDEPPQPGNGCGGFAACDVGAPRDYSTTIVAT